MSHSPTLRVVKIVEYISGFTDKGVVLSEIVKHVGIPKTTVFNIINTLVAEGIIEETGETVKRYRLGFQSFVLAKRYVEKMTMIDIAKPILKDLSDLTNLTAFVAKQDKSNIFYIHKYAPEHASLTTANIGNAAPINTTALGKAYLMTLPNKELKERIDELDISKKTTRSIVEKDILYTETIESRKRGYSIDNQENQEGLICFGAPVYNEKGEYEASISISGQFTSLESESLYGKLIKQAAERISLQLGYRKGIT